MIENIYSYEVKKDGKIFIYWFDKQIKILYGKDAMNFADKAEGLSSDKLQQLISRFTSDFKTKIDGNVYTIYIKGVFHSREIGN